MSVLSQPKYIRAGVHNPEKLPVDDLEILASVTYAANGITHEPFGKPGGPGLWHHKSMQLPAYIQEIAHDLVESGMTESRAIATAVSRCKVWCAGGGGVKPDTKAKACAAVAEWEALKVKSRAESHKAAFRAKLWDPALHPRVPAGQSGGGRFGVGQKSGTPTKDQPVGEGESSGRVTDLQNRLNALGYKVKVDGKFGPQMEAAVRKFQSEHVDANGKPLKVDGLVGPLTTSALRMKTPQKRTPGKTSVQKTAQRTPAKVTKGAAPMPELVSMPGVDLLAAGTWELSSGRNTFTREDIANAVEASRCPAVGDPVIKLGHIDPRFDGEPAIGRVANLRPNDSGDRLVGDLVDMPGWLGSIAHAAYPKRSVEGTYGFKCQIGHTHPFVLTGLALLGVTSPGVGVLSKLPDIASLYGIQAAASGRDVRTAPLNLEGDVVAITEEDVRRAYYEHSGAPSDWWITELQMSPTQLVVSAGDGKIYRVPFSIVAEDGEIQFDEAEPVESYAALASTRGTGKAVTYASAAESRSVVADLEYSGGEDNEDEDEDNGWVQRDGKWVYDPDDDGDDDSKADTDTDHSHFGADGKLKSGVQIPPKPASAAAKQPYGDVEYADPGYLDADGNPAKGGNGVKRYPLTPDKVQAAWSYINQEKNASQYTASQLASIKSKIQAAMKKHGHDVNDDSKKSAAAGQVYDPVTGEVTADAATPPTLDGDNVTGDKSNAFMGHGPVGSRSKPVKHTHPAPAFGKNDDGKFKSQEHTHAGGNLHRASDSSGDAKTASTTRAGGNKKGDSNVEFNDDQVASLRGSLGLAEDEDLTPERLVSAAAALREQKVSAAAKRNLPPGVITIEEGVLQDLQRRVTAADRFREKVQRDQRDEIIDQAIRDGKFSASRKQHFQRVWDADPDGTREIIAGLKANTVPVSDMGVGGGSIDEVYEDEFASLYPPGDYKRV